MMSLGPLEIVLLIVYLAGLIAVLYGASSKRFSGRETLVTLVLAVFVPVIGSAIILALLATKFRAGANPPQHEVSK